MRDKIYFASDFHLGVGQKSSSFEREKRIVAWLDFIKDDAKELYLIGDIFDFWFEYKTVVPKGFIRFLGKLAQLADAGVAITLFKGNHDMWIFSYFKEQLNATIIDDELIFERNGKTFYLHHGDGLGPGDAKYKLLKKIFRSAVCQWLFSVLHPSIGMGIAQRWSKHSRAANSDEEQFLGDDKEWLILYANKLLGKERFDYFIFGHRHLPYDRALDNSRIVNLGEWINFQTYAIWDGQSLVLKNWNDGHPSNF
ncbi:UDP-2,3-diacylglucosamine diphosphatase [Sphingobacterium hungaricum]